MTSRAKVDVPRLIRIVTLLSALAAAALVYLAYEPETQAFERRVDDAQAQLRSDEIAFADVPQLRGERDALARRYAALFAQNPEAVFVRELSSTVRRHNVSLTMTSVRHDTADAPADDGETAVFTRVPATLELRGRYRDLLGAIADLSTGSEIVFVDDPSLRRDGTEVVASIPVAVLEPRRR